MATLLLTAAASALTAGSAAWVTAAATAVATVAGAAVDSMLFGSGANQQGQRLDSLKVQASTEGAGLPEIAGRARVAGQIIWATNFKEVASTQASGGGKGLGSGSKTTTYSYFASFAVALCEGPIDRIGQIWADGKVLDASKLTLRVYTGSATQAPDSLISAIEGAGNAPAYRGTAYVMFDNLPLEDFGNRLPQLNFEVIRRTGSGAGGGLEDLVSAITVIPGAGEFVYDTTIQTRQLGGGASASENAVAAKAVSDWSVSIDELQAALPNVSTVQLVVAWFGDDLRADHCTVRPKVETASKATTPNVWAVHGLNRSTALVMTTIDGRPAYGGTPSDQSVVRAIRDLKARGLSVLVYPFLAMDIAPGNALPNPYRGAVQPAYPWRGRITCDPAPGVVGTVDKTASAASQIASFFGSVAAGQIAVAVNGSTNAVSVGYSGPAEWSYRRFVLHYAKLCAALNTIDAGAVDALLIGSELKALTAVRDSASHFPTVAALKTLAADVKAVVGAGVKLGYGADWSDYAGYAPSDGTGDRWFHLDPLWSDSSIDFVGIDCYVPLSDWRDGVDHLDAQAGHGSLYQTAYLQANIEGGEDFDWYYASDADRLAQVRTPITDGAYAKPWVWRAKDIRNWWLHAHYDRPGGVESASPTAWTPQSKPVWLTELGVPSVDRGSNQPSVYYDPKSSESALPYFSTGARDDVIQRRAIEAVLSYWADGGSHNPVSSVFGAAMIGRIAVWAWDARPFAWWPARTDVWSDGGQWPFGHWLNGKVGLADLAALVGERCRRVGFEAFDASALSGIVAGSIRSQPIGPRTEIETLMAAFGFDASETGGALRFVPRGRGPVATVKIDDCVQPDRGEAVMLSRAQDTDLAETVTIKFIDGDNDYQSGSLSSSRIAGYSARVASSDLPLVMDQVQAQTIADWTLAEIWIGRETARFALPPSLIALDPGDVVNLVVNGRPRAFRITRINDDGARHIEATRTEPDIYAAQLPGATLPSVSTPVTYGAAILELLDLPLLHDSDISAAPYAAVSSSPFAGVTVLDSATGDNFAVDSVLATRASIGETLAAFGAGPTEVFDQVNTVQLKLYSGELASLAPSTILSGRANALAVRNADGDWEILQFCDAMLTAPQCYALTGLLRGRLGTEHAMRSPLASGARVVVLDGALAQLDVALSERGQARFYQWGPSKLPSTDPAWQQAQFTARAVGLMPWAPVHVTGSRDGAGNLTVNWIRRSRLGRVWADGADIALDEESERYELDVLNGATVVRTFPTTVPTAAYSAAQQVADFGSVQSILSIAVYQLSSSVGRGRPGKATL